MTTTSFHSTLLACCCPFLPQICKFLSAVCSSLMLPKTLEASLLKPVILTKMIVVENKAFSLHSSQVCSLLWMTRGYDAGWLDTKYIVMVSAHTTAGEDKLNNTYLLTIV